MAVKETLLFNTSVRSKLDFIAVELQQGINISTYVIKLETLRINIIRYFFIFRSLILICLRNNRYLVLILMNHDFQSIYFKPRFGIKIY